MSDTVELNVKPLEQLIKALKRVPSIKVGILGDGGERTAPDGQKVQTTNAQVGAAHEFGTSTVPQRSFLRVPLTQNLGKRLEASGAFNRDVLAKVVQSGTLLPWAQLVAIEAEGVVSDAFETGGDGQWPPSQMDRKKVHQTLVETQQLRNSITSEVKE